VLVRAPRDNANWIRVVFTRLGVKKEVKNLLKVKNWRIIVCYYETDPSSKYLFKSYIY
jgi:hypothetical protein